MIGAGLKACGPARIQIIRSELREFFRALQVAARPHLLGLALQQTVDDFRPPEPTDGTKEKNQRGSGPEPPGQTVDAFHIGIAAAHQIEYLLTWNCKHTANAAMRGTIEAICCSEGLTPPIICTPEELPAGSPQ